MRLPRNVQLFRLLVTLFNSIETNHSRIEIGYRLATELRRSFSGWTGLTVTEELAAPLGFEPTLPAFNTQSSNRQGCFHYTMTPHPVLTPAVLIVTNREHAGSRLSTLRLTWAPVARPTIMIWSRSKSAPACPSSIILYLGNFQTHPAITDHLSYFQGITQGS